MGPVAELKEEHKLINLMLLILVEIARKLEGGSDIKMEHLDQILEFISVFVDKCHHGKEETLLFYAMEESGISKEEMSLNLLLEEHQKGRQYFRKLAQAVTQYKTGSREASSVITNTIRNYAGLLTKHIEMEESVLYPLAEKRVPEKRQEVLLKEFETLEREKIGPKQHEKFHALLHRLQNIYLE